MISDDDSQLLEAWLDDALTVEQARALDERLRQEAELSAALAEMQQARALRVSAWRASEPSQADADAFSNGLLRSLPTTSVKGRRWMRYVMPAGLVAASLLIGFGFGWAGRGAKSPPLSTASKSIQEAPGHVLPTPPREADSAAYQVALVDHSGHVVATEHFQHIEEARKFAAAVGQVQARRRQVEQGEVRPMSAQF